MKNNSFKLITIICFTITVSFSVLNVYGQTTYYANSSTGNDSNNGLSPSTAKRSFTAAYNAASGGDTLALSGTFDWTDADETGDATITGFSLLKALTIVGDGAGLTFIQSAPTPGTADRCVFTIDHDITLEHLTIRHGFNTNQGQNAGGITVMDQTRDNIVTLNNCIIENNEIDNGVTSNYYFAGGIYLRGNTSFHPDLRLNDCIIRNNSATGRAYGAGGLYSMQSNDVTINRCTFNNNSSTDGSAFGVGYHNLAGGMGFFRFNTVNVTNSTFTANSSETSGGAILSWYNQTVLTNNTIAFNSVTSASGKGGGVYVVFMQQSPGNLYLKNNIIAQNTVNGVSADLDFNTDSWASNIHDEGSNIIETFAGSSITPSGTGTITGVQTNLNLSNTLAINGATNGVLTLALSAGSVAIDAGAAGSNGPVTVPSTDQRGFFDNGVKDIGAYEFGSDAALPVEFLGMDYDCISDNIVDLKWQTASELNAHHFEVMRSEDGYNWKKIGEVDANGTTNELSNYQYIDDNTRRYALSYYRLKQVDFDGAFEMLPITSVNCELHEQINLYPNPAHSLMMLEFTHNKEEILTINILDALGRTIKTETLNATHGFNRIELNVNELPSGAYTLQLNKNLTVVPFNFIINK